MAIGQTDSINEKASLKRLRRRTVIGLATGNILEWYDFAVYSSLASILGALFFDSTNPLVGLLATFSVFAVGYLARPIGAIVFGRLADLRGRRFTLILVVTLMGIGTVAMGVLPTYQSVGVLAPILMVLARIVQGLSVGGEFGTVTAYLVEIAPNGRRGLYGSIIYFTTGLGFALGLGLIYGFNNVLGEETMHSWGWRVPFLLSVPLLMLGVYLRKRTEESPAYVALVRANEVDQAPIKSTVKHEWRSMGHVFGMIIVFTFISYAVLSFVLSYIIVILKDPVSTAYPVVLTGTVIGACLIPLAGLASDRFGRRPVLIFGCVLVAVVAVPAFLLLQHGGFVALLAGLLLLWLPNAIFSGVCPATFCELFPANLRSTSVGLPVAFATAIFSGTTPLVLTFLVDKTGNNTVPAAYLILGAIVSFGFMWRLRENSKRELANT